MESMKSDPPGVYLAVIYQLHLIIINTFRSDNNFLLHVGSIFSPSKMGYVEEISQDLYVLNTSSAFELRPHFCHFHRTDYSPYDNADSYSRSGNVFDDLDFLVMTFLDEVADRFYSTVHDFSDQYKSRRQKNQQQIDFFTKN